MNGSHVEGSETTITMELDSIDDVRNELNSKKNECSARYNALTTECNKDFFGTLSNCAQFNTSVFGLYDDQITLINSCIETILNSINNYVSEQRIADTTNEQELDSIEEPVVESDSSNEQAGTTAVVTPSADKSLDSGTLETKEQDKKELKDENNEEKQELTDINSGKDRNQKTSEMTPSTVKEQEQLRNINNNNGEEQKVADDNYSISGESLRNINNNSTEKVEMTSGSSLNSEEKLGAINGEKISDTDYSTLIDDLIICANNNGVTVDVLLKNPNYSQEVKDTCSLSNISLDFKNSLVGGKDASVVQKDILNSIVDNTTNGKEEAYSKLLEHCSGSLK